MHLNEPHSSMHIIIIVTEFPNNQTGYKGPISIFNCLAETN